MFRKQTVATPIAPVAPQIVERPAVRPEVEVGVTVPLLQNMAGGVAVMIGAVAAAWLVAPPATPDAALDLLATVLGWAAPLGFIVFAVATVFRAFRDEVHDAISLWALRHDSERARIDATRISELQKRVKELETAGLVEDRYSAETVADKILTNWYEHGLKPSRAECAKHGISRPDWEAANEILRAAGVMGDNGKILIDDGAEAWRRVLRQQDASHSWVLTKSGNFAKK